MYSTCWVPLTDACPENSCLYVVPRWVHAWQWVQVWVHDWGLWSVGYRQPG